MVETAQFFREVSIHAPARGATSSTPSPPAAGSVSIHAPARGATSDQPYSEFDGDGFDPRPREGGDSTAWEPRSQASSFDPRPREGGDCVGGGDRRARAPVSIHAPARGATLGRGQAALARHGFDPRPREGGDLERRLIASSSRAFRSTPPRGGRRLSEFSH